MFGSCGRCCCCCWFCGDSDCFGYNHSSVLRPSLFGQDNVTPLQERHSPYPDDKTYGTYHAGPSRSGATVAATVGTNKNTQYLDYENTICKELVNQEEVDEEIFYQQVGTDDSFMEERKKISRTVLEKKRISFQPSSLYNKFSTSSGTNWSLRQQPFFNQVSSTRMSNRLMDTKFDESFDYQDTSDQASVDSGDTSEEVVSLPPATLGCHKFPVYSEDDVTPATGIASCRMDGYRSSMPAVFGKEKITATKFEQLKDEMADVTAEMETLDGGEDGKNNPKSKQMSIGRKKFNMDPKKGIEYLIEHCLLKNTPDDISKFLYNGEGLNKTAIGDYLGERHDFNQTVLDAFVALHDFTDLILVQALRQFLWSFRLPGEAQKIDRMMERFASHYCELNPAIFQHPDTCFVLSFAIIMLNTSLHNPAVKDKQTLEQFIKMNRGIDNGDDLPRELLESLYESIKTEPFKIPEDDGNDLMHTFFNPDREGWLWKQGGRYKSWKRRWFILNDNCLYYFEYTTDKEPRGIIPLENIEVREVHDRNKPHCFELYATSTDFIKACKTDSEGKVVEGKHTVYRMSAATHEEKEEWIKCIRQSISHNPFYDLLAKRKKNIQKNSS